MDAEWIEVCGGGADRGIQRLNGLRYVEVEWIEVCGGWVD